MSLTSKVFFGFFALWVDQACWAMVPKRDLRTRNDTSSFDPSLDAPPRQQIATSCDEFSVRSAKLVPTSFDLNLTFYKKYVNASGLPVVGSYKVVDEALLVAASIVKIMSSLRPDLHQALIQDKVRVAIMAKSEKTSDIPEHASFAYLNWARGLGATRWALASSGAEENILAWKDDHYRGDNIFVHELAHSYLGMNLDTPRYLTKGSDVRLQNATTRAFNKARSEGKWDQTYSASSQDEWFAVGAQIWFDVIRNGPVGGDGVLNNINKRWELSSYDPGLFKLLKGVFTSDAIIPNACRKRFLKGG